MKHLSLALALAVSPALSAQEHGHPHDDQPAAATPAPAAGPIRLTETVARNLDLQTVEAELRPIEKSLPALGLVESIPARTAAVTTRVAGRIISLAVHEGQQVKVGDPLGEVESRVVAEPPPRLTLKAPIDGVVLTLAVRPGEAVDPDKTLLTIADLREVQVEAQVYEAQIAAVRRGQTVRVRAVAHPDETFVGVVQATAAGLDRETGTLRVFVRTGNPGERLLPGMRAQLAFVTAESAAAVVVPRSALLGENGDFFLFREVAPLAFERVPVVVGLRDERSVEIIEGVLPGDRVVTRGNYQLQYLGGAAAKVEDDHAHGPGGHQH